METSTRYRIPFMLAISFCILTGSMQLAHATPTSCQTTNSHCNCGTDAPTTCASRPFYVAVTGPYVQSEGQAICGADCDSDGTCHWITCAWKDWYCCYDYILTTEVEHEPFFTGSSVAVVSTDGVKS